MNCPRDHTELKPKNFKEHDVYYCPCCKGIWLSTDMVSSLMPNTVKGRIDNLNNTHGSQLRCPQRCAYLHEIKINGITIDVCPPCKGSWFDKGEMEALLKKTQSPRTTKDARTTWDSVLDGGSSLLFDTIIEGIFDGLFDGI